MKKIISKNLHTPPLAEFVNVSESEEGIVTVEYFTEAKAHIPHAHFSARVMTESSYEKLVGHPLEKLAKGGKASKDPRTDKKVRAQADKAPARNITSSDDAMGYKPKGDYPEVDLRQKDKPKQDVKKQTKVLKGTHKVSESIANDAQFTWAAIHEACREIGLEDDQIKALQIALHDDAVIRGGMGESKLFKEGPEDFQETEDEYDVQDDIDAVDNRLGTSEPKPEVYKGQSVSDFRTSLVNLSDEEVAGLEELSRNQAINQIRVMGGKVIKVMPATVKSTYRDGDILYAMVDVGTTEGKIKLASGDTPLVKKSETTGIYYAMKVVS